MILYCLVGEEGGSLQESTREKDEVSGRESRGVK